MSPLPHLFSPMRVGPMQVNNRIMMPGMSAGMMLDPEARATPEMIAYYVERARTCPGMIAIGSAAVVPTGPRRHPLAIDDDACLPSLTRLVEAVHQHDTKFGIQLWDGGTQTGGAVQLSPSGVAANAQAVFDASRETPRPKALGVDEIAEVIGFFAAGARRCRDAGFDFVEIHAGHGYLISAFLSPYFNRREDAYGGSFENRSRFLVEMLAAVKAAVGSAVAVGVKINGDDFMPAGLEGWTLEDACRLAPILEAEGADYLSVTAGAMGSTRLTVPPMYEPQACFADMAQAVKRTVSIPVATVGRVKRPQMAEELVRDGVADIVCMGRAMIADSQIVDKARRGDFADIRLCLADCRGCIDQEMRGIKRGAPGSTSCVVNPRMQRESVCIDVEGDKAHAPKTVLVVGGGLAGLEAARRTAFSGHHVTLCESRAWLGGQIRLAGMIPGRAEIADMLPWYERQLAKHGVEVRLNTTADAALLDALKPDVVVVATGSTPSAPQQMTALITEAQGIEMVMVDDVLEHGAAVGDNVLVIGGDQIGMQAADYLSEGGRVVCVVEAHNHFAAKLAANDRWYLTARLIDKQVRRIKNVHGVEPRAGGGVRLVTDKGEEDLPMIDTIVFASERRPARQFAELVRARGLDHHVIGDAFDVAGEDSGAILANIAQAYDVARAI